MKDLNNLGFTNKMVLITFDWDELKSIVDPLYKASQPKVMQVSNRNEQRRLIIIYFFYYYSEKWAEYITKKMYQSKFKCKCAKSSK